MSPTDRLLTQIVSILAIRGRCDLAWKTLSVFSVIHLVAWSAQKILMTEYDVPFVWGFFVTATIAAPFLAVSFFAITRLHAIQSTLMRMARTDSLTGLLNRAAFFDLFARRSAGGAGILVLLDADHFKRINDTFGHAAGDEALVAIASRLRDISRSRDVIGRLGGEEFAMFVPGATTKIEALLVEELPFPIRVAPSSQADAAEVTLSAGLIWTRPGDDPDRLMRAADDALYAAKAAGRATVGIADRAAFGTPPPRRSHMKHGARSRDRAA